MKAEWLLLYKDRPLTRRERLAMFIQRLLRRPRRDPRMVALWDFDGGATRLEDGPVLRWSKDGIVRVEDDR